jgi:hypothetical protein
MDLFHQLQDLIDKNTQSIPENDYIAMCEVIMNIRNMVKPPRFLLNQNVPMQMPELIPPFMPSRDAIEESSSEEETEEEMEEEEMEDGITSRTYFHHSDDDELIESFIDE